MKTSHIILAIFTASLKIQAQGLVDDFNGSSINTSLWSVTLPYSDSSVTEGGGAASIENNGRLTTTSLSPASYSVAGRFYMANNPFSNFKVVLRTDGSLDSTEAKGIAVQFQIQTDGGDTSQNLRIMSIGNPSGDFTTSEVSAGLTLNTWNTFLITDDGLNIDLYFDGATTPTVSATSSYSAGDLITFYNREGSAAGSSISANGITQLDYLDITSVPEPSSLAMIGFGFIGLIGMRRLTMWPNKSPEPTAVGAGSSAIAVHVASRRWLSFFR